MALILKQMTLKDNYVEVVCEGVVKATHSEPEKHLQRILETCRTYNCYRVLIDYSQTQYQQSVLCEHQFGLFVAEKFPPAEARLALLAAQQTKPRITHIEDVVANRGMNLRVFWDRTEALSWLLAND